MNPIFKTSQLKNIVKINIFKNSPISEADPDSDEFNIAKIRHPMSGIKIYEMTNTPNQRSHYITDCMNDATKCQFQAHSNCWRQMLSMCGFMFVPTFWTVDQEGVNIGKVINYLIFN